MSGRGRGRGRGYMEGGFRPRGGRGGGHHFEEGYRGGRGGRGRGGGGGRGHFERRGGGGGGGEYGRHKEYHKEERYQSGPSYGEHSRPMEHRRSPQRYGSPPSSRRPDKILAKLAPEEQVALTKALVATVLRTVSTSLIFLNLHSTSCYARDIFSLFFTDLLQYCIAPYTNI